MKYIITGGPSTGKTTLIEELRKLEFEIVPEVARKIIEREQKKGKEGILPWTDLLNFEMILIEEQLKEEAKLLSEISFLDRGLPDIIAYAELGKVDLGVKEPGKSIHKHIKKAKYTKIFFLEQLGFFEKDGLRYESGQAEANKVHTAIHEAYKKLGFEIVVLPAMSVPERMKIILKHIGKA